MNLEGAKISKETIGNVPSVTLMTLEMNFIIFYNVDTLNKTVSSSFQVTLEIGQMLKFKHIMTVTKKSDPLKLCKMIKVINEGVYATG